VRVTKVGEESFLSQIVGLHPDRRAQAAPELLADRLMNFYGPVVFPTAGLAFAGWSIFMGDDPRDAVTYGRPTVMDFVPCALNGKKLTHSKYGWRNSRERVLS
jgi:cation transport ATPase